VAQGLITKVKNNTGSTISANKAVYIVGFDNSIQIPTVDLADYNDESTFPIIGITTDEIESGSTGTARTAGLMLGFDTSSVDVNTEVFVGSGGGLTFTDPRDDEDNNFVAQKIGVVVTSEEEGQIYLFPIEILQRIRHPELEDVLPDQHHDKLHADTHEPGGEDEFLHATQHEPGSDDEILHASQHESGGADELSHDNLAGVSADDHHLQLHASSHATGGSDELSGQDVTVNSLISNNGLLSAGTSFPLSPTDGLKFYRTDLDWWFTYDSGRSKWLGELEWDGSGFNGTITAGTTTYLRRFDGMPMSNTAGIWIPYNITIIGVSMVWTTAAPTGSLIEIVRDGSLIVSHSIAGVTNTGDMTLNANFNADGILAFRLNLGGTGGVDDITLPQLRCWFRRRAT
jgi:hypothetical protein